MRVSVKDIKKGDLIEEFDLGLYCISEATEDAHREEFRGNFYWVCRLKFLEGNTHTLFKNGCYNVEEMENGGYSLGLKRVGKL